MNLKDLKIGEKAIIKSVGGEGALRQHFLDMGVIPGAKVTVVKYAPMGDPIELLIHGYELTLRLDDAKKIEVSPFNEEEEITEKKERARRHLHPGLGEGGKFHPKGSGAPLPDGTVLTFALVGNQNCGKTTLFNQLTGSNQHVGNFPGVTVDRKDGAITGHKDTVITDLPGIYSMSPYTGEELVSRRFVLEEKPNAIINILDATNIERNLYLTTQIIGMGVPTVVALNMMDEVTGNGGSVDVNLMESMLGVPVVPISAAKKHGISELVEHALHIAKYREAPEKLDMCGPDDNNGAVHRCIHAVEHLIEDHAAAAGLPVRFAAEKAIEGDRNIIEMLSLDTNETETLEHITLQMESERGMDRSAAIADMRFAFIKKLCDECVIKPSESKEHKRSRRIDRILTGKYTAIPLFFIVMGLVVFLTFNVIGAFFQELLASGIEALTGAVDRGLTSAGVNPVMHDLIIGGIFEGVGSVISFLPIIVTMFFFLSMLEDSGYIARVAFVMDKPLRKLGLSGRSIVPLLIGFGCTVPAVMSTRTLPSERDRKMTILLTPFMSCTAKLPIYAFFVSAFFPGNGGFIMIALYLIGILFGIAASFIFKKTIFKGEAVPFVMELPNYRLPSPRSVVQLLWEKTKDFLQRAFTVIMIASVVVWFLKNFDFRMDPVTDAENSILAQISGLIAPVFAPVGLGDWKIVTSLICGFMAKESVVSTMNLLYEHSGGVAASISTLSALSLLVFSLLYTPCVAAVASIRRELGRKWACGVVIWQCAIAWLAAFAVKLIGSLSFS
ncbi:MAG: ferrous iron transport protein B [Clostridia bacterium]|nr:ferrous iron transport protein B [Clostridia bacterium]